MNDKSVSVKVSWFSRAKSAVKAAATKVVAVLSRAKSAVLAKVEPVLKTRAVRVMRTIARWSTILLGAVAAVSALFAAPLVVLCTCLLVSAVVGAGLLVKRYARLPGFMWDAFATAAKAAVVMGKVLFGIVSTAVFCVVVAASAMTPWGVVDFALAFWLLWTIEADKDASTPAERAAAASSYRTARTAQFVAEIVRDRRVVA